MPHPATIRLLADLSEEQWGLFTRRQAEAAGLAWTTVARLADSGATERVAQGVYRLRGVPAADHLGLRAAWLQLAPEVPVWERRGDQGVVSHRSAAAVHHLGHLPADIHEFTLPARRQTRRVDVRLRRADLSDREWVDLGGLLVATPARIAADLLRDREDPEAVAQIVVDALREGKAHPSAVALAIAPYVTTLGLQAGDGTAALDRLLQLTRDPRRTYWVAQTAS
ncbi:type IV toxin-antitoxin system AbiEi family antitoxin domain-containing protein [Polymorphospora rubra]|uniref:type IV toxin-antitoxin system AbiEi family antitoxin domain-containing protein n=1 Tax=Polymorphospora rubra TaxID=338584 RepID=UPI0033D0212B